MAPSDPTTLSLLVDGVRRVEDKLDHGLADIRTMLDHKADKTDVERLREEHGHRLKKLETARARTWKVVGTTLTVACTVALATIHMIHFLGG